MSEAFNPQEECIVVRLHNRPSLVCLLARNIDLKGRNRVYLALSRDEFSRARARFFFIFFFRRALILELFSKQQQKKKKKWPTAATNWENLNFRHKNHESVMLIGRQTQLSDLLTQPDRTTKKKNPFCTEKRNFLFWKFPRVEEGKKKEDADGTREKISSECCKGRALALSSMSECTRKRWPLNRPGYINK